MTDKVCKPVLKLGEGRVNDITFDNYWIKLDNEVTNVDIMNTLQDNIKLPPVLFGKSVSMVVWRIINMVFPRILMLLQS
ncbi:hypothetical protein [Clostridium cavendishii]|uniref:hypothetical protein n=1 Tax=Clostridium cavendishii TaxID=349931 RepID=UPI0009332F4A|nr:hypothetical protein [Clostridium cavendishii]